MRYKNINGKRRIYRIKHKYITSSFCPEALELFDDSYLVSYADSFLVVAGRAAGNRLKLMTSFLDVIGVSERTVLKEFLYSMDDRPIVLKTDVGTAMIDKSITPSTLLFLVSFLNAEKDGELLETVLRSGMSEIRVPDIYCSDMSVKRICEGLVLDARNVMNSISDCFANTKIYEFNPPRINVEKFNRAVRVMSDYCGLAVDLICEKELICDRRFDAVMFNSFLFSMLSLARKLSPNRQATVELSSSFLEGISVKVSVKAQKLAHAFSYPEAVIFFNIADRHNMLFEAESKSGELSVRFCPNRKDWSYLGIKDSFIEAFCLMNGCAGGLPWLIPEVSDDGE